MFFIDVVNYDKNRFGRRPIQHPDIADEIVNYLDHGYPIERYVCHPLSIEIPDKVSA